MLLKVDIKCYCVKNKGGILYEKNSIKRSMPITCIMFELKRSWVSKKVMKTIKLKKDNP